MNSFQPFLSYFSLAVSFAFLALIGICVLRSKRRNRLLMASSDVNYIAKLMREGVKEGAILFWSAFFCAVLNMVEGDVLGVVLYSIVFVVLYFSLGDKRAFLNKVSSGS